ncbi:hypothetical protein H2204_002123 [Knufia peltigerae]|uniref:Uncharacterized protein n=1 Tax=Knufia peltigerae TaxID=1002370 RepID=A0AA39D1J5_9EURO|nr:hypothetical protein H2204_002123 [Knufia peltigerae]
MSRYVSKLVDSLSDDSMGMGGMGMGPTKGTTNNVNYNNDSNQRFVLRPCPADPNLTLIHPRGYPVDAPPLYTVIISSDKVSLYRGYINPAGLIGTTSTSSVSHSAALTVHNQKIPMKMNQLSLSFSFQWPPAGTLKWKADQLTGSSLELSDGSGRKLAKLKSSSGMMGSGEKGFEINVACDEQFLNLIILSGLAAKVGTKKNNEAASEVIQAIVGS